MLDWSGIDFLHNSTSTIHKIAIACLSDPPAGLEARLT